MCTVNPFIKYAWVVPLKDKRGISTVNTFQKVLDRSNKIWVDQGDEFYNNLFNRFAKNNKIAMYSTYNERKSVVAERFIRMLKKVIFKHMTAISKNVYFDVLDDIVKQYKNTVHRTMKPINVTSDSYDEYNEDSYEIDSKFKVGDCISVSMYKSILAKGYTQNWSWQVFNISKIEKIVPWTLNGDLNGENVMAHFMNKNCKI